MLVKAQNIYLEYIESLDTKGHSPFDITQKNIMVTLLNVVSTIEGEPDPKELTRVINELECSTVYDLLALNFLNNF